MACNRRRLAKPQSKPFKSRARTQDNAFGFFKHLVSAGFGECSVGERRIKGATRPTPVRPIAQQKDVNERTSLCAGRAIGPTLFALAARFLRDSSLAHDRQFIDRKLVDLAAFLDERREPSRSRAAARPGFSAGSAELRRHLAPFHRRAPTAAAAHLTDVAVDAQARKLLLKFAALLVKLLVDFSAKRKQRIDPHAS